MCYLRFESGLSEIDLIATLYFRSDVVSAKVLSDFFAMFLN